MERSLLSAILVAAPLCVSASTAPTHATTISSATSAQSLTQLVSNLERQTGVAFQLASTLAEDKIGITITGKNPEDTINSLLAQYNHVDIVNGKGELRRVLITGRKGDGEGLAMTTNTPATTTLLEPLTLGQVMTTGLPDKYHYHKPGSVYRMEIDAEVLKGVKKGESISLFLPDGQHQVVHDNRFDHENGDVTWVGYMKENGKNYRFITTIGKEYTIGQVLTTNGQYYLEQEGGQNYLVDIAASGLKEIRDSHIATDAFGNPLTNALDAFLRGNWAQQFISALNPIRAAQAAPSTITLMALYTPGLAGITSCSSPSAAVTRINNLVATTNQAYLDSSVNITMQLVNTTCVSTYTNNNNNSTALSTLTSSGQGTTVAGFPTASGTPTVLSTRNSVKADLVTLLRPFVYPTQSSCGVAWQNNSLSPSWAYSVVSDGSSGGAFCTNYTLAHETGHNMGNAHGNTSATGNTGKYAYSYGYGISGIFGTIMNYFSPRVGKFSNPALSCPGTNPCGITGTNDNAKSLNTVAATVAAFK